MANSIKSGKKSSKNPSNRKMMPTNPNLNYLNKIQMLERTMTMPTFPLILNNNLRLRKNVDLSSVLFIPMYHGIGDPMLATDLLLLNLPPKTKSITLFNRSWMKC